MAVTKSNVQNDILFTITVHHRTLALANKHRLQLKVGRLGQVRGRNRVETEAYRVIC